MSRVLDVPRAVAALEAFLELQQADRRDRALAPLVDQQENLTARALAKQSAIFRREMKGLKTKWQDDGQAWIGDWLPYLSKAQEATRDQMQQGLFANILQALILGSGHLVEDVGMPMSIAFGIVDPRAVDYASVHAGSQIRRIEQSTRDDVNKTITAATARGASYSSLMKDLQATYAFSRDRARNIAVFEMGDAYEGGRLATVNEMRAQGLEMVKSWSNVGDSKVRPAHRENAGAGWIGIDDPFPGDGAMRSPTDPRCRCTILYKRRVPDETGTAGSQAEGEEEMVY